MTREEKRKRRQEDAKALGYGGVYRSSRERQEIANDVIQQKRNAGIWDRVEDKAEELMANNYNWNKTASSKIVNFASTAGKTIGFASKVGDFFINRANDVSKNLNDTEKNKQRATAIKNMLPLTPTSYADRVLENANTLLDKDKSIGEKLLGIGRNSLNYLPRCTTSKCSK